MIDLREVTLGLAEFDNLAEAAAATINRVREATKELRAANPQLGYLLCEHLAGAAAAAERLSDALAAADLDVRRPAGEGGGR